MPKLFEVFGYPLSDRSDGAAAARRSALCPFMNGPCDGGGNRYLSSVDLRRNPRLAVFFEVADLVPAGVCSIQVRESRSPWIVCPRRLLALGRGAGASRTYQELAESEVLALLGYPPGTLLGIWAEVKIQYQEGDAESPEAKSFDYTFDYIVAPIGRIPVRRVADMTGQTERRTLTMLEKKGYVLAKRNGVDFVDDFVVGPPCVVEIMTSSTSGGNQRKRTTVPLAFEDALLGFPHAAPGINYRQVWARMVSQLIVKSEVALAWGGKTIWIVQDVLVDYISASTALNIAQYLAEFTSEVNMLSLSYGESFRSANGVIELTNPTLYAGKARPSGGTAEPTFQDIIHAPAFPSVEHLTAVLANHRPISKAVAP